MPIKPHKGESQSDWMERCVPEMIGTGSDKRPQDQAVAACLDIWRTNKPGSKAPVGSELAEEIARWLTTLRKLGLIKQTSDAEDLADDAPEVDEDESHDDYIERCVDELTSGDDGADDDTAEQACQLAWENRSNKSARAIRHKTQVSEVSGMEFCLSDETIDRMGDIIKSDGWQLDEFRKNPVALFGHRSDFLIGTWENVRVEKGHLRGHLKLAPEGTSPRIDEIRRLIEAKILRATSVGFKPLESEPRKIEGKWVGDIFTKQELVECSLVSVPANPNALAIAKNLKISDGTLKLVFAEHGTRTRSLERRRRTAEHGNTPQHRRSATMATLAERIAETQTRLTAKKDALAAHLEKVDDSNVKDDDIATLNDLNADIQRLTNQLAAYTEAESRMGETSGGGNTTRTGNGSGSGSGRDLSLHRTTQTNGPRPFTIPAKKEDRLDMLARAGAIMLFAHITHRTIEDANEIVGREYPAYRDEGVRFLSNFVARSASAPALTTVVGWAAELVTQIQADIVLPLMPKSIYPRLSTLGTSLQFGRAGRISVPTRSRTPTIAGSFVGEGQPIPVRQGAFTAQIITPKKMAVISSWSREMDEHSVPAIEGLIRDAIEEDTAVSLDSVLIDANAATAIRPAGLLNGVAGLTPTAGGGFAALTGDIKQLSGAILGATQGNIRNMVWLMNPQQVLSAGLTPAPGVGAFPFKDEITQGRLLTYPIIDSGTVPLGTVIAMDAADFVTAGSDAPRFEISDQATLHFEDTTPLPINGGTPAVPTRSLWQTDTIALRLIIGINWVLRRTGTVAYVAGVTW